MEETQELHEFYAVTISGSLYRVSDKLDTQTFSPIVEKIGLKGESRIAVGERLTGGSMVGLTKYGLQMYSPDSHSRIPSLINNKMFGGKSSPIVALFLDKDDAEKCLYSPSLQEFDPRWIDSTCEVLRKINNDHLTFVIDLDLPPEFKSRLS